MQENQRDSLYHPDLLFKDHLIGQECTSEIVKTGRDYSFLTKSATKRMREGKKYQVRYVFVDKVEQEESQADSSSNPCPASPKRGALKPSDLVRIKSYDFLS